MLNEMYRQLGVSPAVYAFGEEILKGLSAMTTRAGIIWSGYMLTASTRRRRWCGPRSPAAPMR